MWDGNLLKTVENGTFIECCQSCTTVSGCKGWEWQTWGGRTICSWYDSLTRFAIKPTWASYKAYQCITTTKGKNKYTFYALYKRIYDEWKEK
jgi:hypothetical protein